MARGVLASPMPCGLTGRVFPNLGISSQIRERSPISENLEFRKADSLVITIQSQPIHHNYVQNTVQTKIPHTDSQQHQMAV